MDCSESRPSMINSTADKQEVHKLHLNNIIGIEIDLEEMMTTL